MSTIYGITYSLTLVGRNRENIGDIKSSNRGREAPFLCYTCRVNGTEIHPMYDPRPLEDPAYWLPEAPNTVEWVITRHIWNRSTKEYDVESSISTGTPEACFHSIVNNIRSSSPEFIVEINAEHANFDRSEDPYRKSTFDTSLDLMGLAWVLRTEEDAEEYGTDIYELMERIGYLMETKHHTIVADIERENI